MRRTRNYISGIQTQERKNKRVLVGISGGVDSSVSALLLKQQGYDVEGVFAKVWQPDFVECTWRDEMRDAMRVCARLDIPFHFLDLEQEYKQKVADYMLEEYQAGRTPNPDVMCNTHIKFGMIYDFAKNKDFDYVAMGHYARNDNGLLTRGEDPDKDQSYFLWNIPREKFDSVLFPIGHLKKAEVRSIAQRYGLFTSEKKDSQGLCFIGPVDMKSFLRQLIDVRPGAVLDTEGNEIGTHSGVQLYTVGERHGFTIKPECKERYGDRLFVIGKHTDTNELVVDSQAHAAKRIQLGSTNILAQRVPQTVMVQFRYRQHPIQADLEENADGSIELVPHKPAEFVAIGQSAVLYDGPVCIGGGIVDKVVY